MARNLRAKMPADEVLVIQDINRAVSEKFAREHPNNVRIVDEVRDLAEQSVCARSSLRASYDETLSIVLSMMGAGGRIRTLLFDCTIANPLKFVSCSSSASDTKADR